MTEIHDRTIVGKGKAESRALAWLQHTAFRLVRVRRARAGGPGGHPVDYSLDFTGVKTAAGLAGVLHQDRAGRVRADNHRYDLASFKEVPGAATREV